MGALFPRISVCITHYNRPEKLEATLESLANQTRVPDEVFLWDDCSPKNPTEVVNSWKHRFPHFVYHRNAYNLNMPQNLNAVLSQATGDFVANLHDADIFDPRLLELWADALLRHPTAGMAYCGLESPAHRGKAPKLWLNPEIAPLTMGTEFFQKNFLHKWSSPIWGSAMVRKSVYDDLLPFRKCFRNWSDVDMWMRISLTHDIAYVNLPLIKTDETDTPLRGFNWEQVFIQHRMAEEGIRIYCKRRGLLSQRLFFVQYLNLQLRWVRHMVSGVYISDWARVRNGMAHWYKVITNTISPVNLDQ